MKSPQIKDKIVTLSPILELTNDYFKANNSIDDALDEMIKGEIQTCQGCKKKF